MTGTKAFYLMVLAACLAGIAGIWLLVAVQPSTPGAARPAPLQAQGTVDYVVDGDTLRLTDGRYVRLLGIDAPEAERQDGTPADCWAQEAATALHTLAPPGTPVTLTQDPSQDAVDRWGRMLAYVDAGPAVPDVAEELLRQGAARTYTYRTPVARATDYWVWEGIAQQGPVGLWTCAVS